MNSQNEPGKNNAVKKKQYYQLFQVLAVFPIHHYLLYSPKGSFLKFLTD